MIKRALIPLGTAWTALASPFPTIPRHEDPSPPKGEIQWGECAFDSATKLPIECGRLAVPLDYTSPNSTETLELSLLRSSAVNKEEGGSSKGSILFNFGGPGYEAILTLNSLAEYLHSITGGQHDLIAFDPRGVANTMPYSCFHNATERELMELKYPLNSADTSDVALGESWAGAKILSGFCEERAAEAGGLIGTPFVARDMMQIVDALDEDGLLRFWGLSYGSVLGATVAALFPDRMDRLVLDGVVNSHNYYNHFTIDVDQFLSADDAFRAVLAACIEAGPRCALSDLAPTAEELEEILLDLTQKYKYAPVAAGKTVINHGVVSTLYQLLIKYPSDPVTSAALIRNLVDGTDLEAVAAYFEESMAAIAISIEAVMGIKCGDTIPRSDTLEGAVTEEIEYMASTSRVFGYGASYVPVMCAQWPLRAKEQYEGNFEVKTKHPILFVGNTYDPVTPVVSAKNMSASFEGSVVLEQKGFGHGTTAQTSDCTAKILQAYFVDGTLPEDGTVCEVDQPLFPAAEE